MRSPWYLRQLTDRLATPRNAAEVLRRNLGLLGEPSSDRYLFDPHVGRYTGGRPALKLWIGGDHLVDKGPIQDLVHTAAWRPCMLLLDDNFHVERQAMVELLGLEFCAGLNWVADRAILGLDCLGAVVDGGQEIVTWLRGYQHGGWQDGAPFGTVMLTRPRNDSDDLQSLRLDWQAGPWSRDSRVWRVAVRVHRERRQEPLDVAVLAAGTVPGDTEAVAWIFSRWPQESSNHLDDHDLLRALTRAPGFVAMRHGTVCITLAPNSPSKAFAAMRRFCENVSAIVNRGWPGRASSISITVAETPPARALGPPPSGPWTCASHTPTRLRRLREAS